MRYYNRTNTCDKCGINFDYISGHPYREYDEKENFTGKWICNKCYTKADHKKRLLSDRRTGNLDPNSRQAMGDRFEELTCKWKNVKNILKMIIIELQLIILIIMN